VPAVSSAIGDVGTRQIDVSSKRNDWPHSTQKSASSGFSWPFGQSFTPGAVLTRRRPGVKARPFGTVAEGVAEAVEGSVQNRGKGHLGRAFGCC